MPPVRKRQKLETKEIHSPTSPVLQASPANLSLSHTKATTSGTEPPSHDPRTLFVRQLAPETTTQDLTLHFSNSYPIKHAVAVLDSDQKTCKGYGFVTFADPEDAARALSELNGSQLLGRALKIEQATARHRGDESKFGISSKPLHQSEDPRRPSPKIIVRNLPWSIDTTQKLSQLFLSYGRVKGAFLPRNSQGRLRGFGIVIVRGQRNSEQALEGLNGKVVDGRELAVDWAADRETWESFKKQETSVDQESKPVDEEMSVNDSDAQSDDDMASIGDEDFDAMELDEVEELDDANEDGDDNEDMSQDDEDNDDEPQDDPHKSSTLFIRNLPFTTTDEDLRDHFSQFGPIRYARIVYDPTTEQSKGVGFVCFIQHDEAQVCLKASPKQAKPDSHSHHTSILQDQSIDPDGRYTMSGRVLILAQAVEKREADKLQQEGISRRLDREKTDKRRLYLLSEGRITPKSNPQLHAKLAPSEQTMRDASYRQRKTMVEKNPSLHLSLTRLAIRNIPRWLTSKHLKALARKALVGFATEMKQGQRLRLSKEELSRGGDDMRNAEHQRKLSGKGVVKQAKVVFETRTGTKVSDSDRKRSGGGKGGLESKGQEVEGHGGRSRGYGFIEYWTHRASLMGLRWMNGRKIDLNDVLTPDELAGKTKNGISGPVPKRGDKLVNEDKNRRLIVEFALENINVTQRRSERERKSRSAQGSASTKPSQNAEEEEFEGWEDDKAEKPQSKNGDARRKKGRQNNARGNKRKGAAGSVNGSGPGDAATAVGKDAGIKDIIVRKRMAKRARMKGRA
jgi:nucleolar protein 4